MTRTRSDDTGRTRFLPAIPGGWATRTIPLANRSFQVTLPACPDAFLDDIDTLSAHATDDEAPYWGYLWPISLRMAAFLLRASNKSGPAEKNVTLPKTGAAVLELGSGIGLVGLAALACGFDVTFSDCDAIAVQLALFNAQQNAFHNTKGIVLDWRHPELMPHWPFVLGCDITYDIRNHQPLLHLLDVALAPDGVCWIGDPGRWHSNAFYQSALAHGFHVAIVGARGQQYSQPKTGRFQVYVLNRRSQAD